MPYVLVPIIGTGTMTDPFRPALDAAVTRWSAHIPSKPNGTPQFPNCYVFIPDGNPIGTHIPVLPAVAQAAIRARGGKPEEMR